MPTQSLPTDPFETAKKALRLIGEISAPPTPKVFEVLYRYAEGTDKELRNHLDQAQLSGTVRVDLIESLHGEFCVSVSETEMAIGESLADEITHIQGVIQSQREAGECYEEHIGHAMKTLRSDSLEAADLDVCVAKLASDTSRMGDKLQTMSRQLADAQRQVSELQRELTESRRKTMTDHLTGIGNRRFFDGLLKKTVAGLQDQEEAVYLAYIDLDHFKQVNDTFGHQTGDGVIRFVATEILNLRPDVSVARVGGDEFAALMRAESRQDAVHFAEEVAEHFRNHRLTLRRGDECLGKITLSMGIARLRIGENETDWCGRADELLYKAKQLGRDQAVIERSE
ncbi:MAG: GGDEF domain-containing protein [Planctomycetota bacterium]